APRGLFSCRPETLLKRDLGKAPQLARMEPCALLRPDPLERIEPDVEVLTDALAVELARHPGELDLAVHRLVGDAEQRPVRDPKAEAVRRDRRGFHIERDRARLGELAYRRRMVGQLPVAVVDAAHRAGAHHALQ